MPGIRFSTDPNEIPCQIIQASAKVVDGVAEHQHPVCRKLDRAKGDDDTLFVCVEVLSERPSRKPFALSIAPPPDVSVETVGMVLRPLEFQPNIQKPSRRHEVDLAYGEQAAHADAGQRDSGAPRPASRRTAIHSRPRPSGAG